MLHHLRLRSARLGPYSSRHFRKLTSSATYSFPGAPTSPFVSELRCHTLDPGDALPTFRLLPPSGRVSAPSAEQLLTSNAVSVNEVVALTKAMISLRAFDDICLLAQKQGRIAFYAPATGEEGAIMGATAALHPTDEVYSQYREGGVLQYRLRAAGKDPYLPLLRVNVGSERSTSRGTQMPIHYGDPGRNFQMVSSTVATQTPNAVGAAYALRGRERIAATFFGDGGSSTGDAHGALNMAATLRAPVLFLVRNNGFAISTPAAQQMRCDGVAGRAVGGYGLPAFRVDGTDALATFVAVRAARKLVAEEQAPALVEMLSVRGGNHSTSDEASQYRDAALMDNVPDPVARMCTFCATGGMWAEEESSKFGEEERKKIVESLTAVEKEAKVDPKWLFEDVYDERSPALEKQRESLLKHLRRGSD